MNRKTKELNRSNNALDQQISPENREAFTDMICYLRGAKISAYHQELVRYDLTEMVLSAQQRGEKIREVIGEDYKGFCDNVIASLPPETRRQRIIDFFDTLCWGLSILGFINIVISNETIPLIRNAVTGKPLDFSISISLGSLIVIGIILTAAFVIVEVITSLIGLGITAGILAISIWLGRVTLFTINLWIACSIVLALYVVHKILDRMIIPITPQFHISLLWQKQEQ